MTGLSENVNVVFYTCSSITPCQRIEAVRCKIADECPIPRPFNLVAATDRREAAFMRPADGFPIVSGFGLSDQKTGQIKSNIQ